MYSFNTKLWLAISTLILVYTGCKSTEKKAAKEAEPAVIEQPKPAMELQTDSLKKVLDEQRRLKKRP